jgi:hypothetical protein
VWLGLLLLTELAGCVEWNYASQSSCLRVVGNTYSVPRGQGLSEEGEVVRDNTSGFYGSPLILLCLLGREVSVRRNSLMRLIRDTRGALLPAAMSGGAFLYLQGNASANPVLNTEWSARTDLLLALVLVTCFFCDTACSTALEIFAERLIAPFWDRVRERRPASTASSAGVSRSLRQWLCSPSRNEKNSRPCRSTRVSQNRAPPQIPSLSTYSYI